VSLLAERAAKGGGKKPKAARSKKAPVPANDVGEKPKAEPKAAKTAAKAKKRAAPKKKAKAQVPPPRTGTDG